MDDNKFKEELSKIAKWYIPVISEGSGCRGNLRKPMPDCEINPSMGPVIEELLPLMRVCDGCSKICDQRCSHTLRFKSIDGKRDKRRWEHSCQTCKMPLDPETLKVKEKTKSAYMLAKEQAEAKKKNTLVE
jgi:hypothetical protein